MKAQQKVKFVESNVQRIWNVSDHPNTDIPEQVVVVAGRTIMPGQSIKVASEILENATKVQKAVDGKLLFIGEVPPKDYRVAKGIDRAQKPKNAQAGHGAAKVAPENKRTIANKAKSAQG